MRASARRSRASWWRLGSRWSRSRGAFAGISLKGSTLREDNGENKELYGSEVTNRNIVAGKVNPPKGAEALMKALGKY